MDDTSINKDSLQITLSGNILAEASFVHGLYLTIDVPKWMERSMKYMRPVFSTPILTEDRYVTICSVPSLPCIDRSE
ncbi:hypothetical protein QA599_19535 [Haloarculaceae archaeon H-GB1-1]|nr:hypothetical protein [Haloarculaceae archaeon H-GB1-1]